MNYRLKAESGVARTLLAAFVSATLLPGIALAQVPVDENGEIIGEYVSADVGIHSAEASQQATGNEEIPLLSAVDLEELVGPIALYPDDLLAVVLPASAYPLQVVDAARFLEALEIDPSLKPDPNWDDSVVALINYPEVVELLNDDIDWTWRLGEAVVSQQPDVVAAIETFRDRAYAAGNLKSDAYQNVTRDEGIIEIVPIADDVIYVPYYEPERVVVYQPRPVYYYYPRPCPVYYYPYSSTYAFDRGRFWGVTTAFSIGWYSDSLSVFHHSYRGHPYYGQSYWNRWWYRRPTMNVHNNTYVRSNTNVTVNRYYGGDRWQPRANRRDFVANKRATRNREHSNRSRDVTPSRVPRLNNQRQTANNNIDRRERTPAQSRQTAVSSSREPVQFRTRTRTDTTQQRRAEPRELAQDQQRMRRAESRQRRTQPTPKVRRTEPVVQARRTAQVPQTRRAEPQRQTRRAEPQRQARRAEPPRQASRAEPPRQASRAEPPRQARRAEPERSAKRAEPQRQESVAKRSVKRKAERKTEQRSGRRSERAVSRDR